MIQYNLNLEVMSEADNQPSLTVIITPFSSRTARESSKNSPSITGNVSSKPQPTFNTNYTTSNQKVTMMNHLPIA